MNKRSVIGIIIAAVIYLALFVLGSSSGLIHPACYAYVGTVLPFLFALVYLYTASKMQCFGAAAVLNGFVLVMGLISGEGNLPFVIILILLAGISEYVRYFNGYDTIKGINRSFIPFAFSFYAYTVHWWTDTAGSLEEAVEEMPMGYADKMEAVIHNTPGLVIALILVIPVAVIAIRIAGKVMKKQLSSFS